MWLECLFWHFKVKGSSSVFCYGWDANCRSESPSNLQQIGICGLNVRATRKRPKWPVLVHIAIGAAAGNLQTHYLHSSVGGIFIIFGCIHLVLYRTQIYVFQESLWVELKAFVFIYQTFAYILRFLVSSSFHVVHVDVVWIQGTVERLPMQISCLWVFAIC